MGTAGICPGGKRAGVSAGSGCGLETALWPDITGQSGNSRRNRRDGTGTAQRGRRVCAGGKM
ncbi:hypothetical protein [Proteus mirabilis]|uniref:hypothetical protein n=1 Tax=Proteus mirabilis TaxID=584 RepID=UPI001A90A76C|nr:hypothetical protein [Proteus mirabilis]